VEAPTAEQSSHGLFATSFSAVGMLPGAGERSRQDLTHPICLSLLAYLLGLHSIQIGLVQIGLAKTCTRNCHVGLGV
jgi:hypothetical protein